MPVSEMTLWVALGLYAMSAFAYVLSLSFGRFAESRWPLRLAVIGLAAHTAGMLMLALELGRFALPSQAYGFTAWVLMCLFAGSQRKSRGSALGLFACLIAVVLVRLGFDTAADGGLMFSIDHHWAAVHFAASLAGYAGFTLSLGAALAYALQGRMLKAKRINGLQRSLPSLDAADALAYRMVAFGFLMLTLAIVSRLLWMSAVSGVLWQWDGGQIWSLAAWLVYLAYLHIRVIRGWRGKWANRLLIIGFACLIPAVVRSGLLAP